MSESLRARGGTEPLQPAVIRLYTNLVHVYRSMRERQKEIDAAFDRVAAQIGFVVTTTLPVRVEVAGEGAVKKCSFDGEALGGTIFERELSGFLEQFAQKPFSGVPAGTYRFYLIWHEALNLKLKFDCFEWVPWPLLGSLLSQQAGLSASALVRPEVEEPTHWFDPGLAIAIDDALVILAIDEVYADLRLVERIQAGRLALARFPWGGRPPWIVEEQAPVSFSEPFGGRQQDFLANVRAMLRKQRR